MCNPEKSEIGTSTKTPFRSFGYREMEKSRVETLQHRSPEMPKCEIPKTRNRCITRSNGYRDLDTGRWRSQRLSTSGVPKCRNAKSQKTRNRRITRSNGYRDFGYREIEMSRTLVIRSPENTKCEMVK
jgi:hypothetical protein